MAFQVIWSPTAILDLKDIRDFIAEDDPTSARAFVQAIFEAIERLPAFPQSGRKVPEFNDPSIREVIRRPCRIVYRVREMERRVEITRIWYAARGIPEI
jgi:toxin ParE1/3/4